MNYVPKLLWRAEADIPERVSSLADGPHVVDNLDKLQNGESFTTDPVVDLRQWCSPVEDQGHAGSCVGNGTVAALELLQNRLYGRYTNLSRLFVYYNARLMTQDQDKDVGSYISVAFETLKNIGTCSEENWPYDLNNLFARPTWSSYGEAYANKVNSYYKISGSGETRIDVIKCVISSLYPVVFGMKVDQAYMDHTSSAPVPMFNSDRSKGGHCQVIVGFDNVHRLFIVKNSWGTSWGCDGYALVPFEYLDAADASDFYVPTIAPNM